MAIALLCWCSGQHSTSHSPAPCSLGIPLMRHIFGLLAGQQVGIETCPSAHSCIVQTVNCFWLIFQKFDTQVPLKSTGLKGQNPFKEGASWRSEKKMVYKMETCFWAEAGGWFSPVGCILASVTAGVSLMHSTASTFTWCYWRSQESLQTQPCRSNL